MSDIQYGFVDSNNQLLEICTVTENDTEMLEFIKNKFEASAYYPVNDAIAVIGSSIWTGNYFTPGSPYPSWVWDESKMEWVAPMPYPENGIWQWNENKISWVPVQ